MTCMILIITAYLFFAVSNLLAQRHERCFAISPAGGGRGWNCFFLQVELLFVTTSILSHSIQNYRLKNLQL
jgi:hypothetical protein